MAGILFWLCILLIAYVYAGYPALVFMLSRLRPERNYQPITPSVTLLIAAYNEEKVIREKLENSLSLDYPREKMQILVADDGSSDRTAQIAREYAGRGVELNSHSQRQGKVAALNRAMQEARGEIVIFSDANNYYAPDAIHELVKPFADELIGAVSGARVVQFVQDNLNLGQAEGIYWHYESFIKECETRLGCCVGVSGEQLAIRRKLFVPFPLRLINDDLYISLKLIQQGYNVVYAPAAKSRENVSASPQDEVVRKSRIVAGRYQIIGLSLSMLPFRRPLVVWQIVSHKYLRPLVPFFMLLALVFNLLAFLPNAPGNSPAWLTLKPPINGILLTLQALFYLLALIGNRFKLTGSAGKFLYMPAYLVASNYAALLGLFRYISGRQTALWKKVSR